MRLGCIVNCRDGPSGVRYRRGPPPIWLFVIEAVGEQQMRLVSERIHLAETLSASGRGSH